VPKYSIRCRVKRQTGHITNGNFITDWLDANGNQIFRTRIPMDSAQLALVNGDTGWHELSNIGPGGTTNGKPLPYAKYMSWSVELIGDATVDSVVCVGAVHISATDLATYPVYRNPRSVVLLVDWTDISVTIDQRIALAKLRTSARDWIPANVDFRILTSEAGAEYLALTTPPGVGDPDGPVLYNDGRVEYGGDWELLGVPQLENNVEYNQHDFPGSS
jgi:hypothetical protein